MTMKLQKYFYPREDVVSDNKDNIKSMIDSIASGKLDARSVVDSFVVSKGNQSAETKAFKCTDPGCTYETVDGVNGGDFFSCPKCGSAVVSVEEVTFGSQESTKEEVKAASYKVMTGLDKNPIIQYTLACLRPGDEMEYLVTVLI